MRSRIAVLILLGALFGLTARSCLAENGPVEMTATAVVRPGSDTTRFWSGILDQSKPYVLIMDVRPVSGRKFVAGSAKVKSGGKETWVIKENSETRALFIGTVPPRQALGRYKPVFTGLFQPAQGGGGGGGGGGKGGGPEDLTWKVTGIYEVGNHVYENSGAVKDGNPNGKHKINPTYDGIKTYDVDVAVKDAAGNIRTMAAVSAAMPAEAGSFRFLSPLLLKPEDFTGTEKTGQKDPTHGDNNMVRYEITETFSNADKYHIEMPKWVQLTAEKPADQPGPAAKKEWDQFYAALLAHEEGHKQIYEDFVKQVQAAVDAYAKTLFFGEACYGPGKSNETSAHNRALELARAQHQKGRQALIDQVKALTDKHTKDQDQYDTKTKHGANQKAVGGTDVVINGSVPLQ